MRAVILAGGRGSRLRPFTALIPKPLVPLTEDKSILDVVLGQLKEQGFTRVTLAVNHFAKFIHAYFGDGASIGLEIDYSLEEVELGTMGPLRLIKDLPDDFLVMNGDILTDLDFGAFLEAHSNAKSPLSVATFRREERSEFGVLQVENEHIIDFLEKPLQSVTVSMGVYAINRATVQLIPEDIPFGFDDLMNKCLQKGVPVRAHPWTGQWLDIGRPRDYETAQNLLRETSQFG